MTFRTDVPTDYARPTNPTAFASGLPSKLVRAGGISSTPVHRACGRLSDFARASQRPNGSGWDVDIASPLKPRADRFFDLRGPSDDSARELLDQIMSDVGRAAAVPFQNFIEESTEATRAAITVSNTCAPRH